MASGALVIAFGTDLLSLYVSATSYEESLFQSRGFTHEDIKGFAGELRGYFSSLPADQFPNVVALASALTAGEDDERFEFGLTAILLGLESLRDDPRWG